jgi:hypothetical protein
MLRNKLPLSALSSLPQLSLRFLVARRCPRRRCRRLISYLLAVLAATTESSSTMSSSSRPAERFPPSKLGEYKVVDEIAEGTFGKVKSTLIVLVHAQITNFMYFCE